MIGKFLFFICVIQEKKYFKENCSYSTKRRLNPYHPLSYLVLLGSIIVTLFLFGIIGAWKEINLKQNPFKYH